MRKLATLAGAFSAAVFLWRYGLWPLALGVGVCCVLGIFLSPRAANPKRYRLRLGLALLGIVLALGWSNFFAHLTLSPWEGRHKEREVLLEVEIQGYPTGTDRGQVLAPARITDGLAGSSANGLVYLPGDSQVRPGDRLTLRGTLYLADRVGEEEITYYSAKGLYLRVYTSAIEGQHRPESIPLAHWPAQFSHALGESLMASFGPEAGGLAKALVIGDKAGLSDHFQAMSRRAGLAHVIVISGMHMGFLAGALHLLLRKNSRMGAAVILLLLAFFALAAGSTPSAWRAVLFCAAGLIAPLVGRENDPPTSLCATLMLLLVVNPFSAASISLQLSFAAVAGIFLLTPRLLRALVPRRPKGAGRLRMLGWRLRAVLGSNLALTLGAILFTTPLSVWYFGMVSLVGPVSNLLTFWAVSAAFLGSALVGAVGLLLPGAAALLAWVVKPFLSCLLWLVPRLGELPLAAVTMTSDYYAIGFLFLYALLCLNLFWPGKNRGRLRVPALCVALLAVVCFTLTRLEFALADLTLAVLDVGQGQSVCLRLGDRTVLVDCGGTGSADPGDVAADYLANLGEGTLDLLVLTHYHADHANGVAQLMNRLEVKAVALPDVEPEDPLRQHILDLAAAEGAQVTWVTSNMPYPLDGAGALTLYAPLGDGGANEQGLSVLATSGEYDVLITGDMNATVERRLVKYGGLPDIEVLVVGNHGSKYSTDIQLLETVRPETAIVSVGKNNSYGHPALETLNRLDEAGAIIYRTDLTGTVQIHQKTGK